MTGPKAFFEEHGYYLAKGVYSADEIKGLELEFDQIVRQLTNSGENVNARWESKANERIDGGGTVVLHTHNVQSYSAQWLRAFMHNKFLNFAESLLGPDIVLHHSKLFQKPAENGAPFPMHQDWSYFPTEKDSMLAAVIHVSEADSDMGCFRVYPGSHKLGRLPRTDGLVDNEFLEKYPIENATELVAEPGDVLFFHYFTLHGSLPNRSEKTRKTVLVQMHSGDDKLEDDSLHPNAKLVLRGWNHRMSRTTANQA